MKKTLIKVVVFVVIVGILLQGGYIAYSMISDRTSEESTGANEPAQVEATPTPGAVMVLGENNKNEKKRVKKQETDISDIGLSADEEDSIKNLDKKNADKNIKNIKKLLKEQNVPDKFRKEIFKLVKKKHKLPDLLVAYEFLSENYGTINELEGLVAKKESGQDWPAVFKDYTAAKGEFAPRDFPAGYLEKLFNSSNVSVDDVMIADRASKKDFKKFEELIGKRKSGKSWLQIKTDLDVVNTEEKMMRMSLSSEDIKEHTKTRGFSEKQATQALVLAEKLGKDGSEVINEMKAGKSKEDILAEYYAEKYN